VVRRAVTSFGSRHPGRKIRLTSPAPGPIVEAEEAHLALLLENLLSNAVKYSPSATLIEVKVKAARGEAQVTVLDRGIGLDDISNVELFQPFRRSPTAVEVASGLGLGLALCQRSIEALGGRIWARTRRGGGAEVGFALPIPAESTEIG
jgi:signal transduction histidine kinase